MTKLIVAILLIVTGLKVVTEHSAFQWDESTVKLALMDEEGKKEKNVDKQKCDNEYQVSSFFLSHKHTALEDVAILYNNSVSKLSPGFDDMPFTPPDIK